MTTRPVFCVFIATSLDGHIARPNGSIDWLMAANARVPPGEDCGYSEFIGQIDALVMGRKTFEQVLTFDEWPYGERRVVVMSRNPLKIPEHLAATVSATSESPASLASRMASEGVGRVYVDGGLTIQSFLAAGLVDELTITTIPVLLGAGLPLFGSLERDVALEHVQTRSWDFGLVQSRYRVVPD